MKKILIITGSPRKDGNSDLLAKAFIEGAKIPGNEIMLFEAGKMNISGCAACGACFSNGSACSFDDDFSKLVPMLEKAEVIVFCSPLYWFTFPAQLKAAIDRMYAYSTGKRELKIKEAMLMVCAATDDNEDFEGIIKSYKLILNYLDWVDRGILTIPNVSNIGDIKNTGALAEAKNLGLGIL